MREFIQILCHIIVLLVIVRAIVSWFPVNPGERFVAFIYRVTEPILSPVRRIIPRTGPVDLSPLFVVIILELIASLVGIL